MILNGGGIVKKKVNKKVNKKKNVLDNVINKNNKKNLKIISDEVKNDKIDMDGKFYKDMIINGKIDNKKKILKQPTYQKAEPMELEYDIDKDPKYIKEQKKIKNKQKQDVKIDMIDPINELQFNEPMDIENDINNYKTQINTQNETLNNNNQQIKDLENMFTNLSIQNNNHQNYITEITQQIDMMKIDREEFMVMG